MSAGLVLNRSRQVPAEDTPAFGAIAERFRRGGDLDRAVALCRDGLAKFPNHMSARVTLGWALLDLGKYDEAQAELEQVLRRAPDNLAAIRGLAQLHERAENAVLLPLDGPGAWPPEPETIESAAAASSAAADAPSVEEQSAAASQPAPSIESAAELITTGRAPVVDVPADFAPVALTSPAEMAAPVVAEASTQQIIEPVEVAKAAAPAQKRPGFLPIQVAPTKVVRPQTFESIVDEEMPAPADAPASRGSAWQPAEPVVEAMAVAPIETAAIEPLVEAPALEPRVEAATIDAVTAHEPIAAVAHASVPTASSVSDVPAISAFAAPSPNEPIVDEAPALQVSAFAQPTEPVLDEAMPAVGLTGFAGDSTFAVEAAADEFSLGPVLDDYVPPPADEPAVSEFALSADAPELQQLLSLEDVVQPYEHAEAQPQFEAIVDEPMAPVAEARVENAVEPAAHAIVEPVAEIVEPVRQAAVEIAEVEVEHATVHAVAPPAADVIDAQEDPLAFRLTEPVAMAPIAEASTEEVASVPEGVLAFDFETTAPVVAEPEPVFVAEAVKPAVAEVVSIAERRQAAKLVALERFLSRVESRRTELAAQPLAG